MLCVCREKKLHSLNLNQECPADRSVSVKTVHDVDKDESLFCHSHIGRYVSLPFARLILGSMAERGLAEFESAQATQNSVNVWIYWKPLAAWADVLNSCVEKRGLNSGSIVTLYELLNGDDFHGEGKVDCILHHSLS